MSASIPIREAGPADARSIAEFLRAHWSATTIAAHGEIIDAALLPALIAGNLQGLATYRRSGKDAELVSINAVPAGAGTGTALIEALAKRLIAEGSTRLWLTTPFRQSSGRMVSCPAGRLLLWRHSRR